MTPARDRVGTALARLLAEGDAGDPVSFLGLQYDLGLAWVDFPEGQGGLGVAADEQRRVSDAVHEFGGPDPFETNPIGYGMAAPTLVAHGTNAHRCQRLRPLFTGEEIWCQLFSEPGAGSDLAGLATSARRDGDEWRIEGQKVWTSLAHESAWGLLLARTDPDAPKHAGLTAFALDMSSPGVDVRPIVEMTGVQHFNEVFLDGAVIPDQDRLGAVGDGWRVALTTLMSERVALGARAPARGAGAIARALELWKALPEAAKDEVRRDELIKAWIDSEIVRLCIVRAERNRAAGTPGPEGSIGKLVLAETDQRVWDLCMDIAGPPGLEYDYAVPRTAKDLLRGDSAAATWMRSRAYTIEGGTSEVLRNVLAERVLGLPSAARADRGKPWRETTMNNRGAHA